MTVAENIFLGREPVAALNRVDFRAMNARAQALLDSLDFDLSARAQMKVLPVAMRQLVENARALSFEAEVIIMDEPSSALGEAERLMTAFTRLREQGKGIIHVSHRLSEIFGIADRGTVFRDGAFVTSRAMAEISRAQLIRLIVGRPLTEEFVKENTPGEEVTLSVQGLGAAGFVRDVSLEARRGEILALYGLKGSGRSEIFERLFGLSPHQGGAITLLGRARALRSPREAIAAGLAFVTEDRKESGLVLSGSLRANLTLTRIGALSTGPVRRRREAQAARRMIDLLRIKAANDRVPVRGLSGESQQKVVLGK